METGSKEPTQFKDFQEKSVMIAGKEGAQGRIELRPGTALTQGGHSLVHETFLLAWGPVE